MARKTIEKTMRGVAFAWLTICIFGMLDWLPAWGHTESKADCYRAGLQSAMKYMSTSYQAHMLNAIYIPPASRLRIQAREMEERDSTIVALRKILETNCGTVKRKSTLPDTLTLIVDTFDFFSFSRAGSSQA